MVMTKQRKLDCNSAARQLFHCFHQCSGNKKEYKCPKYLLDSTINKREIIRNYNYYIESPDGHAKQLLINSQWVDNSDNMDVLAVLTATDITISHQIWNQLQQTEKMAMVSTLAAGVAHEIKNPLTSARGLLQLLSNLFVDNKLVKQHVQVALEGLDRINLIINELEQLAQPTKPRLEFTQIEKLMEKTIVLIENEATYHKIMIERVFQSDLPFAVVDVDQMKQVFLNLLLNAIKAMPNGGKLAIYIEYQAGTQEFVIKFKDTGVGIEKENLSKIFTPFYTTSYEGTGLGLSICQQLVQSHGGRMDVKSEPNRGTVVTIFLPVIHLDANSQATTGTV